MADESASPAVSPRSARVRVSKDLVAGLVLVVVGAVALCATRGLAAGSLRAVGPGALPRALALLVLAGGAMMSAAAVVRGGEPLGRWPLRGPVFVTLAILAFAATVRTVGLALAGPVVVVVSSAASPETRPVEILVFAVVMTAFSVGLFRYALGLPIPILILPGLVTL